MFRLFGTQDEVVIVLTSEYEQYLYQIVFSHLEKKTSVESSESNTSLKSEKYKNTNSSQENSIQPNEAIFKSREYQLIGIVSLEEMFNS